MKKHFHHPKVHSKRNFFFSNLFIFINETKDKHDNPLPNPSNDNNYCVTRLFTSAQTTPITTTIHSRQSISSTTESGTNNNFEY
jgi:hypothetical protein